MENITTQVLVEIRDEIRRTNQRLDATVERLDTTILRVDAINERLDGTNTRLDRLERRQVDAEVRITTELAAVVGAIHEMRDAFLDDRRLALQVNDHERRIQSLEQRGPG
jgi:hypothetical protein